MTLCDVGDGVGWSVSHCGVLVGSCCLDSLHHSPDLSHQLLPQQETLEALVVQQRVQQHPLVHLCQGM